MKKILCSLFASLLTSGLLTPLPAHGTPATWTQLVGSNASGSWNVAANPPWSIAAIPGAGDSANFSTLDIAGTSYVALDGNQSVDSLIFGDATTSSTGIWFLVPGTPDTATLTLTGVAPEITVNSMVNGQTAIEVPLAGSGGLIKSGVGRVSLTNNTFTGKVLVNAGTLGIGRGDTTLGAVPDEFTPDAVTLNGGVLYNLFRTNQVISMSLATNRGITIGPAGGTLTVNNAAQTLTINGALSGEGVLIKNGAGRATFAGQTTNFTGKFNVTAGTLSYGVAGGDLGSNPESFVADGIILNSGALLNSGNGLLVSYTVPDNRGITLGTSGGIFNVDSSSGNVLIFVDSVISGGQLRKTGGGGLVLSGANTYTGGTIVSNGSAFTATTGAALIVDHPSGLGLGAVSFVNTNSLTGLRYTGASGGVVANNIGLSTVAGLTNRWVVDNNLSVTFAGNVSGGESSGALFKDGPGTLVLGGNNSYRGATRVENGTLLGRTGGSISNSPITVNPLNNPSAFGVRVTDNTRQFVCANLEFEPGLYLPVLEFGFATVGSTTLAPLLVNGQVAFTQTPTVRIQASLLPVSTGNGYPLMTWNSMTGTAPESWNLELQPAGFVQGSLSVVGNTLYLQINSSTQPLRWKAGDGNWDTINFEPNWITSSEPPYDTYFADGDAVQFEDTQNTGGGTVSIGGTVAPASVVVNSTNAYTLTGTDGVIAGPGSFTKSGSGTLTLAGDAGNTFTGGLTVNEGTVVAAKADGTDYGATGNGSVTVNGGARIVATGTNSLAGISTASSKTLTLNAGAVVTNTGAASSRMNRVLLNGGVLGATLANAERGSWALDQGVATLGGGTASVITGGNLALSQIGGTIFNVLTGDTVDVFSALDATPFSADTGVIKNGLGALNLWGSCTSTGAVVLNSGTLRLGSSQSLPSGTLNLVNATIASTDATPRTFANPILSGTASAIHTFGDAMGTGPLTFTGPVTLLTGTTGRGLVTQTDVEFTSTITGNNGPLTKTGPGTLTLSGVVTVNWSGGWNINAGGLRVNGSLVSTSAVTIASAARLSGSGTIEGPVVLNPGSAVEPGASIGTLRLSTAPAWTGATVMVEIDQAAPVTADKLVLSSGGLNFDGATLVVTNLGPLPTNGLFTLFSPGNTGAFAALVLPPVAAGLAWDATTLASEGTLKVGTSLPTTPTEVAWSLNGNQLTLSWPANYLGWTLQAQTNSLNVGISNNWVDVPGTDEVTTYTITVDPALPTVFYRLRD
jgi:fibronectin-binding autotransporter adhesin